MCILSTGMLFNPSRSGCINNTPGPSSAHARPLHPVHCLWWSSSKFQVLFLCSKSRWTVILLPCGMSHQRIICEGAIKDKGRWFKCFRSFLSIVSVGVVQAQCSLAVCAILYATQHGVNSSIWSLVESGDGLTCQVFIGLANFGCCQCIMEHRGRFINCFVLNTEE